MYSKNDKRNNYVNNVIKIFFILFIVFNNLLFKLQFEGHIVRSSNCYFIGDIFNLNLPKTHICNKINALNDQFYYYNKEIKDNFDLLAINMGNSKINDIFLLFEITPFINGASEIYYKINNKQSYRLFKYTLKNKIRNQVFSMNQNNFNYFINNFESILSYKWEKMPTKNKINEIRYIINRNYNESYLDIFDKALNFNFKSYLNESLTKLSFENIDSLMSK